MYASDEDEPADQELPTNGGGRDSPARPARRGKQTRDYAEMLGCKRRPPPATGTSPRPKTPRKS